MVNCKKLKLTALISMAGGLLGLYKYLVDLNIIKLDLVGSFFTPSS
jgi:hypothetical protein